MDLIEFEEQCAEELTDAFLAEHKEQWAEFVLNRFTEAGGSD
jgi:hypothetical protein